KSLCRRFNSAPSHHFAVWKTLVSAQKLCQPNHMRTFIIALLLGLAFRTAAGTTNNATADPITCVFLKTGPSREKTKSMSREELSKMQSEHVGNFGVLLEKSKLFAAGPLGDN